MSETGIYVFCGLQHAGEADFGEVEIEGKKRATFTVHYQDAALVAAEVPMKIYTPTKENLMAHQSVISTVMSRNDTVIPISFGNVFHSQEDVHVLLENLYPQFAKLFPEIKGKIELGLKVIGKKEWLEQEVHKNPKITAVKKTVQGKSESAGYYDRMKLGEMAQNFFVGLQKDIEGKVFQPLKSLSAAAKANEPIGETMLLNAAFLIDRDKEKEFDHKINEVHEVWQDKVDFKYSGPWPAYNFINIKLQVDA
ncbi:GvpL/GvpF family gas vesicle protein [Shouchella patagoniensis]|uniref:GvpL/GvpF family gas vesicle protein n=1 Tax=Shouchella patagoniensis TaxID=228576 RepID=UPI0009959814|nr:GvpL/GvpF family gas vesicle protein [Shouchella patagoniensis]